MQWIRSAANKESQSDQNGRWPEKRIDSLRQKMINRLVNVLGLKVFDSQKNYIEF